MTREECRELSPGQKIIIDTKFAEGEDDEIRHLLGKVVTFKETDHGKWIYTEEGGGAPFHHLEIAGIVDPICIDDENIPYHTGDIGLIFGEVLV